MLRPLVSVSFVLLFAVACARDGDGDGIPDGSDRCPRSPFGRSIDEQGCSDVARALERGIERLRAETRIAAGDIWVLQRTLRVKPDPALGELVSSWVTRLRADPFRRQIDPTAPPAPLPEDPGSGLKRLFHYVMAPFGAPPERALRFMTEYLAYEEVDGYVLTHQFYLFPWCEEQDIALPSELQALRPGLLERIAAEQAGDAVFTDLWAERAATLLEFSEPRRSEADAWIDRLLSEQHKDGIWADTHPSILTFDGQRARAIHTPSHTTAFALWSFARFLERYANG